MIVICSRCKGTGILTFDKGGHKSDEYDEECTDCEGSGRLKEETTTTYEPFKPGKETTRIF